MLPRDGGDASEVLQSFRAQGVDLQALGERLQREGAEAFTNSWRDLMELISAGS